MGERRDIAVGMCCSAAGPALACVFTNPADVAKTRLAMERELMPMGAPRAYGGVTDCLVRLWRNEGLGGLQRGLRLAMVREGSKNTFRIGLYEPLTRSAHRALGGDTSRPAPSWLRVAAGATTGAFAAFICNPLDLVKTRLQLEAAHPNRAVTAVATVRELAQAGGAGALWRGCVPNMYKSSLATSITLPINSKLKDCWPTGLGPPVRDVRRPRALRRMLRAGRPPAADRAPRRASLPFRRRCATQCARLGPRCSRPSRSTLSTWSRCGSTRSRCGQMAVARSTTAASIACAKWSRRRACLRCGRA